MGVCVSKVSKIKRAGSDIVHQCRYYYLILSMIYVLNNFNHAEILQIHTSLIPCIGFACKIMVVFKGVV